MAKEEDANEELSLQGDSKPQGINSSLQTQSALRCLNSRIYASIYC